MKNNFNLTCYNMLKHVEYTKNEFILVFFFVKILFFD